MHKETLGFIHDLAALTLGDRRATFEAIMAYTIWTRDRFDDGPFRDLPFLSTFITDSGYDAVEMAIFVMNGKQKDVYIECLETGSIFSTCDMHVLKHPWLNLKF